VNAPLDINIVLDVFLKRDASLPNSAAVLLANHEKRLLAHLPAATLPTVFLSKKDCTEQREDESTCELKHKNLHSTQNGMPKWHPARIVVTRLR
jgi:hypothetical protein